MKKLAVLLLMMALGTSAFCQKDKASIESSITKFFDGLSEIDSALLQANATNDFILLENGHVWNMDTLVTKMNALKGKGIQRANKFQFIETEQAGDIAWVSYHNTAEFTQGEKKQSVTWLESAVLKREGKKWKIKLLHSTRVVAPK